VTGAGAGEKFAATVKRRNNKKGRAVSAAFSFYFRQVLPA
jgi:hypothetical protein